MNEIRTPPVLIEGFVVEATCRELTQRGWQPTPVATTAARGVDIVARRGGIQLHVEAKGAGSSRSGSLRYGKSFNSGQVDICVAKAAHKALEAVSAGHRAAIALPDNSAFRARTSMCLAALRRLDIAVFWVSESGDVTVDHEDVLWSDSQ